MNKNKEKLKKIIEEKVFLHTRDGVKISQRDGLYREDGWIFDFRKILMNAEIMNLISEIFWEEYKEKYPFQIGSLEVAGIPLSVGLMHYIYSQGKKDMNSFFIRKSRKKDGLLKMIEGEIQDNKEIILVDDILNSGKSFIRQIEVLEELGHEIKEVWAIMSFRDDEFFTYFKKKNIKVNYIFNLNDFQKSLGDSIVNRIIRKELFSPALFPFEIQWKFSAPEPNLQYVVPKSNPIIDNEKIYFGSDSGWFWALNQKDGSVAWKFKVGHHAKGKSIFSSPTLYKNLVIFGAYDGNLYALNKETGKKEWINFEADWIGSSPSISEKLGLGFVGLEFGLIRKRGGILAFNLKTGKTVWKDTMPSYTHSSPLFIKEKKEVVIGSNDGIVRIYDAQKGIRKWEFKTGDISEEEITAGFSHRDIKEGFAYDKETDSIAFGSSDGFIYIIDRKDGLLRFKHKTEFAIVGTPLIYNGKVFASSLDKHLYALDLKNGKELWKWNGGSRLFSNPVEIKNKIYIGTNGGRMVEIDPETGQEIGLIIVPERITNSMIYNEKDDSYFLPTFANEIYKLKRKNNIELKAEIKRFQKDEYKKYLKFVENGYKEK